MEPGKLQCYCGDIIRDPGHMVPCTHCKKLFHPTCFKSVIMNPLHGDIFYKLTCQNCSSDHEERVSRIKLQWFQVVYLALYNLPTSHFSSKSGYYRWREHICGFIDKHWIDFFGPNKKKTTTWCGTVAGTLSQGCPHIFKSGMDQLKESGWWRLAEYKPPTTDLLAQSKPNRRPKADVSTSSQKPENLRSRRAKTTSIKAAMELKARRLNTDKTVGSSDSKRLNKSKDDSDSGLLDVRDDSNDAVYRSSTPHSFYRNSSFSSSLESDLLDQDSCMSFCSNKSGSYLSTQDLSVTEFPECLFDDNNSDSDYDVDPCAISPAAHSIQEQETIPPVEQLMAFMDSAEQLPTPTTSKAPPGNTMLKSNSSKNTLSTKGIPEVKPSAAVSNEADNLAQMQHIGGADQSSCSGSSSESVDDSDGEIIVSNVNDKTSVVENVQRKKRRRRRKRAEMELIRNPPPPPPKKKCVLMSMYDERQLLSQLQSCSSLYSDNAKLCRLKRKLTVRQLQREHGLSVFNVDEEMKSLVAYRDTYQDNTNSQDEDFYKPTMNHKQGHSVLDRYHLPHYYQGNQPISFLNRLVGTEDDQLQSIRSPYSHRLLKPFIRRDYDSRPLKMKLLMEIQAYPHRNDPTWTPDPPYPIDFCYVRPQHIASVNSLCREFFWPHIDLAECLQYPDFSCVVLYRRFVIGFAFMVPDVEYNKAYISFAFTHPEWRKAGIAKFMIYHLIQTCMGKDVTLHVSASNPAMIMYQKFGFKPQEFIQDFYDKYFPIESKECRHAFLLRLSR